MKKTVFVLLCLLGTSVPALAEWTRFGSSPDEPGIRLLAVDPADSAVLYAATDRRVYRTTDAGASWKSILSLRGENRVRTLFASDRSLYAGGDRGLRRYADGKWEISYQRPGRPGVVRAVAAAGPGFLWLGTDDGLYRLDEASGEAVETESLPKSAVHSIVSAGDELFVAMSGGVFGSDDSGRSWRQVFFGQAEDGEETVLQQFSVEEIPAVLPAGLAFVPEASAWFAATPSGLLEGKAKDASWNRLGTEAAAGKDVRALTATRKALYAATAKGVYRWDPATRAAESVSDGLSSADTHAIVYDAASDALFAATSSGLYRMPHPDFRFEPSVESSPKPGARDVLARFAAEPSIRQVQQAAILYAEVHPDKIRRWRAAAARKAWLPTLSLDTGFDRDQNVDIDRGGTGDPDRFILGPEEKSFDWSVGLNWDLGEIVWNDDQTSIDTRSKLMAEFRDEILSEVTHLYYERRRLQAQTEFAPPRELPVEVERHLKLEELTARIDALTGGFLSDRLTQVQEAAR